MLSILPFKLVVAFLILAVILIPFAEPASVHAQADEPEVVWGVFALADAAGHRNTPTSPAHPLIITGIPIPFYICFRSRTGGARRHFDLSQWAGVNSIDSLGVHYYLYWINLHHAPELERNIRSDYSFEGGGSYYTFTYNPDVWAFSTIAVGKWSYTPDFPRTSSADLAIPLGLRPRPWDDLSVIPGWAAGFPGTRRVRMDFSNENPARLDPCTRDYYGSERPEEPNYVYGNAHIDGYVGGSGYPVGYPPVQMVRFRSASGEIVEVDVYPWPPTAPGVYANGDFSYGFRLVNAPTRPRLSAPQVIEYDKSTWHFESVSIVDADVPSRYGSGLPARVRVPLVQLPLPLTQYADTPHFSGLWDSDGRYAAYPPGLRIDFGGSTDSNWYRLSRGTTAVLPPTAPTVNVFDYTAVLSRSPRLAKPEVAGVTWTCRAERCTARSSSPTPDVAGCAALARTVWLRVVAYGNTQRKLDRAQIDECNRVARVP